MQRDLRLYYFDLILHKVRSPFFKVGSLEEARSNVEKLRQGRFTNWNRYQFVVVEYFDTYRAEIVEIIPKAS